MKNSDDQGTRFDLRAEVYRNGALLTSGETYCIQNLTRNANQAKEVTAAFAAFNPATMNGVSDTLSLKVLTRIGTNGSGAFCGGHSNAVGVRLYFDSLTRPAKFGATTGGSATVTTTIGYTYDPLYRLTAADYSDGKLFHYTYDSVGNRLTQQTQAGTTTYTYDSANRIATVNGTPYTFDANGNLLNDGTSTYAYDAANRLTSVTGANTSTYTYNGLGDRLSQTVNSVTTNYSLDLNTGLTQILADGSNSYLYGLSRIGELQPTGFEYHLGDALGSVRQLTDVSATVMLAKSYEPFGSVLTNAGVADTVFQFTGEQRDASGLTFLRARYLSTATGRFVSRDPWRGSRLQPMSYNAWLYVYASPINWIDPSGYDPNCPHALYRCAEERLKEIISDVYPNGAEALFRAFEDAELSNLWGVVTGRTSQGRLDWLLRITRGGDDYLDNLVPSQFNPEIDFGGDCGFSIEFQDQRFFRNIERWGNENSGDDLSNQVGHFLSAVGSSTLFWRNLALPYFEAVVYGSEHYAILHWQTHVGTRLIIGHEKIRGSSFDQFMGVTDTELEQFYLAVQADERGDTASRDDILWTLLDYRDDSGSPLDFGDVLGDFVGASLQDMRLSLKGYRFALWIEQYGHLPPQNAAEWLRYNLGPHEPGN